jgi:uncharacterized membrane protein
MIWKIILGLGIVGLLFGLLIGGISFALPIFNPRISSSEAAVGMVIGGIFLILSFPVALLGGVMVAKNKKKSVNPAQVNSNQFGS